MSNHDPLQKLWTQQTQEPFFMSLADIHERAERFQTRIRWRNAIEYGAGAIVVFAFGALALETPDWGVRVGVALIIAGTAYIMWQLARRAGVTAKPEGQTWAAFHRAEMVRQHAALSSVWRWYLAPMLPGVAVFIVATAFVPKENEIPLVLRLAVVAVGLAWVAAVFFGVAWINARAAKKLEAEIAALDRARE
jgi:hypothetical protein